MKEPWVKDDAVQGSKDVSVSRKAEMNFMGTGVGRDMLPARGAIMLQS